MPALLTFAGKERQHGEAARSRRDLHRELDRTQEAVGFGHLVEQECEDPIERCSRGTRRTADHERVVARTVTERPSARVERGCRRENADGPRSPERHRNIAFGGADADIRKRAVTRPQHDRHIGIELQFAGDGGPEAA